MVLVRIKSLFSFHRTLNKVFLILSLNSYVTILHELNPFQLHELQWKYFIFLFNNEEVHSFLRFFCGLSEQKQLRTTATENLLDIWINPRFSIIHCLLPISHYYHPNAHWQKTGQINSEIVTCCKWQWKWINKSYMHPDG